MKRNISQLFVLLFLFLLVSVSCEKDDDSWKQQIDELKNELNVQKQLILALQQGLAVRDIVLTEDGYAIELTNDNIIYVTNKKAPLLSIDEEGNWLINGETTGVVALDTGSGIPKLEVRNGYWFIDGVATGVKADADEVEQNLSTVTSIIFNGKKAIFLFNDGTQLAINIELPTEDIFVNDICLPATLYMLSGVRNDIFAEPFIKRWRPYNEYVRFSGAQTFTRRLDRVVSIDNPQERPLTVTLVEGENFTTVKSVSSMINVGKPGVGEGEVTVQVLGDSFTAGAFFRDALLDKDYVPGVKMVGLRKVEGTTDQYDEGRGGWTLNYYFNIPTDATNPYWGYMQPDGEYQYWGATGFWINAHKVAAGEALNIAYACGRFDEYVIRFDAATGYVISPRVNDVQFDNALGAFVMYNGTEWVRKEKSDFNWNFNYSKYLAMWDLPAPDFFAEMLGLNDFRGNIKADFTQWNERIKIMKESYLKAVPHGKFIILIPCSTCGILNNVNGDFTLQQNAAMWRLRKNIIDTFDKRGSEGYYLVDIGITIDNENGYLFNEEGVQWGNPHPYPNYPTMGIPLAAFIQYHRKK